MFSLFGTMNIPNVYAKDNHKEMIEEVSPKYVGTIERTVIKNYSTYPVPKTIEYHELVGGFDWWGTLHLVKVEKIGSSYWKATYQGKISGTL